MTGNPTDNLALGVGIGRASEGAGWSTFIGSVHTSATLLGAELQFGVQRGLLVANAEVMRNHLLQTNFEFVASRSIVNNFSTGLQVRRKILSDGNASTELNLSPAYRLDIWGTNLSLGYRFDYLDYQRQNLMGYYGPRGLISNGGSANWSVQWRDFYSMMQVDLSHSVHADDRNKPSEFAGTGTIAAGRRVSKNGLIEAYWTAGRDALGTPAGWRSMNMGGRLDWLFW